MDDSSPSMTPDELVGRLVQLFPDFAAHRDEAENLADEDEEGPTLCGAFSEFSDYFRERYEELPPARLQALGWVLAECMAEPDSELDLIQRDAAGRYRHAIELGAHR